MIHFERLTIDRKPEIDALLHRAAHRGCAFSFASLYLWGRQCVARVGENLLLFSHFQGKTMYPYPVCPGSAQDAIELLIADSKERGIPLRLSGLNTQDVEDLERWYPGQFRFHCGRDGHEYVYAIDDLADLKGKKYQPKRNHINRFLAEYPDAVIRPLDESTLPDAKNLADRWYQRRTAEEDAGMELVALNRAFARHIREKYPQVKFLNREEDMGLEGLRKAKLSYYPHHMVEKCWAHLMTEEFHDY